MNQLLDRRNRRDQSVGRRAFTFVEMSISLVIVSMVLAAAAAFSLSTAQVWQQGVTTDPVTGEQITAMPHVIALMAGERLENELSGAESTGGYYAGSLTDTTVHQADLMLWKNDADRNKIIAGTELELIEYDAANHMLVKYIPGPTTVAPTGFAQFNDPTWIATYRATATMIPLARHVDGAQFYVQTPTSATQKPLVEYQLRFVRDGQVTNRYGAICMRAPTTPSGEPLN